MPQESCLFLNCITLKWDAFYRCVTAGNMRLVFFYRNWTFLALNQTYVSLRRSSGRGSSSTVTTCRSTCRVALQRMKTGRWPTYVKTQQEWNHRSSLILMNTRLRMRFKSLKQITDRSAGPTLKQALLVERMAFTMAPILGLSLGQPAPVWGSFPVVSPFNTQLENPSY